MVRFNKRELSVDSFHRGDQSPNNGKCLSKSQKYQRQAGIPKPQRINPNPLIL